ncbi:hypothetical protein E2562_030815 [Oryza meyeriana var. granulata]|uniref:Protein kinase domain-containing protein n=1 Tax=Oryza meyeriana var. granulata TaxID=110450 RepID=A0A6G1DBE9_9ORYZ|nr:hypothetical protein E2562_030815 [Oryza meyeriana var. granulata]
MNDAPAGALLRPESVDAARVYELTRSSPKAGAAVRVAHAGAGPDLAVAATSIILLNKTRDTAKEVLAKADIDPNVRCFTRRQMKRITNNYGTVLGKRDTPMLVNEFVPNEIAVGAAQGLVHLHSCDVVHGDVRTANILLDDFSELELEVPGINTFPAKIAGFGTAKLLSMDKAQYARFLTENVCYMDPQFLKTGVMAKENDVYGFGMVLVELLTQERIEMHDVNTLLEEECGDLASYHVKEIKEIASKCLAPKVTEASNGRGGRMPSCSVERSTRWSL